MTQNSVCIFWDESHIWGIMAWRAIRAFGLSCRLVKSSEIAQGGILSKGALILLVPGGGARLKAAALGAQGRAAIRQWLADGGAYIGICGGAGLALTQKREADGLAICPWSRGEYASRLFHLLSGHVVARADSASLPLPIWWPGRFAPGDEGEVRVLARYDSPAPDLWLADLPLAEMPQGTREKWRQHSGFDPLHIFPPGHPLVVAGRYGKGRYLLSYAHLETPQSPGANHWFAELLGQLAGVEAATPDIPVWICQTEAGGGEIFAGSPAPIEEALPRALHAMGALMRKGMGLGLFFRRTSWLMGWRPGLAGMACNSLLALLRAVAKISPSPGQRELWRLRGPWFLHRFALFIAGAEDIFWHLRLEKTMESGGFQPLLKNRGQEIAGIFGHPMLGGGVAGELLSFLEELLWLGQDNFNID